MQFNSLTTSHTPPLTQWEKFRAYTIPSLEMRYILDYNLTSHCLQHHLKHKELNTPSANLIYLVEEDIGNIV